MFDSIPLTVDDVLNAAIIAALILLAVRVAGRGLRAVLVRTRHIQFDPAKAEEVRSRCIRLFPVETLKFNGTTFTRGVIVRIVTRQQLFIEGEFVGANHSNMLCLVTHESIIAQELHAIETIQIISRPRGHV